MADKLQIFAIGCLMCFGLIDFGCATARVNQPLTATTGSNDEDAQADFWDQLSEQPIACNDDFCHAMLLYLDKKDPADNYAGRVEELKRRGLLQSNFDRLAYDAVDRGVVAVAIVRALNIHGGLMMTLLGPQPRYAMRELQYLNLYPVSSPQQEFSGLELVGVISKMEDYQKGDITNLPASVMPGDAAAETSK